MSVTEFNRPLYFLDTSKTRLFLEQDSKLINPQLDETKIKQIPFNNFSTCNLLSERNNDQNLINKHNSNITEKFNISKTNDENYNVMQKSFNNSYGINNGQSISTNYNTNLNEVLPTPLSGISFDFATEYPFFDEKHDLLPPTPFSLDSSTLKSNSQTRFPSLTEDEYQNINNSGNVDPGTDSSSSESPLNLEYAGYFDNNDKINPETSHQLDISWEKKIMFDITNSGIILQNQPINMPYDVTYEPFPNNVIDSTSNKTIFEHYDKSYNHKSDNLGRDLKYTITKPNLISLVDQIMVQDINDGIERRRRGRPRKYPLMESSFNRKQSLRNHSFSSDSSNYDLSELEDSYSPHISCNNNGRIFSCPIDGCGRAFARKYNLHIHMSIHNPDRSKHYACPCGKKFFRQPDLVRHRKVVHRDAKFSALEVTRERQKYIISSDNQI